ncbi:hypothetical protein CPB86DRAFT_779261 [Serendipita vermifera]|nr:hypothetical protein CPB86DRAFT_779261 [Serendipita vermifera]
MVRIRKKTSNRVSTAHRAKVKKKARESKKKNRKEAKKNPQIHKKKKKKDPGIPNSFPFKDQILAEVAEARRIAMEEKQQKKDQKQLDPTSNAQATSVQVNQPSAASLKSPLVNNEMDMDGPPPLIDTTIPNTAAALEVADLVVEILDARDPLSYRSEFLEKKSDKQLFFILNKTDLVPRESVTAWTATLRRQSPTFLFRSSSSNLPAPVSGSQGKSKSKVVDTDSLGRDVLLEALHQVAAAKNASHLSIAVVGVTNVGKSSFINSMLGNASLSVYNPIGSSKSNAPCTTPHPQAVTLIHKKRTFKFIDTPGFSFIPSKHLDEEEREKSIARDILLRNRGNIVKINDPLPAALYVLSRANTEDMLMLYNLPAVQTGDYDSFLAGLARKEGALQKKGAVIDFQGAARAIVRDWKTGRLAYYTLPPKSGSPEIKSSSMTPKLQAIFEKNDERLFSQIPTRKELRRSNHGLVQLSGGGIEMRTIDFEATVLLEDDDESMEDEMEDKEIEEESSEEEEIDTEGSEEVSTEDNDEESGEGSMLASSAEEVSDEEPVIFTSKQKLSGKERRQAKQAEKAQPVPLKKKSVSFAPYTKAGAKVRATSTNTSGSVPRQKQMGGAQKGQKGSSRSKAPVAPGENDAYDFSKYF